MAIPSYKEAEMARYREQERAIKQGIKDQAQLERWCRAYNEGRQRALKGEPPTSEKSAYMSGYRDGLAELQRKGGGGVM